MRIHSPGGKDVLNFLFESKPNINLLPTENERQHPPLLLGNVVKVEDNLVLLLVLLHPPHTRVNLHQFHQFTKIRILIFPPSVRIRISFFIQTKLRIPSKPIIWIGRGFQEKNVQNINFLIYQ